MQRHRGRFGARPVCLFEWTARRRPAGVFRAAAVTTGAAAAAVLMCAGEHAAASQVGVTWTGGAGNWDTAANWAPAVVPNNSLDTYNVFIDGGKSGVASAVTLDDSATIDNLTVDSGDSLTLTSPFSSRQLTFFRESGGSTITNNGQINLGGTLFNPYDLVAAVDLTLAGSGQLTLTNPGYSYFVGTTGTQTVTNGASHTIAGAGVVDNFRLVNDGTISANVNSGYLSGTVHGASQNNGTIVATGGGRLVLGIADGASFVNNGTMRAFAGSELTIGGTSVDGTFTSNGTLTVDSGANLIIAACTYNNAGKTLQATAGQTIIIEGGLIDGGSVSGGGAGRLAFSQATLRNVSMLGNFLANDNAGFRQLTLSGTITNNVAAGTAPEAPDNFNFYGITFPGDVTLAGGGTLTFDGLVTADATQGRLIIPAGKVVQHGLVFELQGRLSNSGTFRNTAADQHATISCVSYPQSSSNSGTLQVIGAGNDSSLTIRTSNPIDSLTNSGVIEASGSGNRLIIEGNYVFNVGGGVTRAVDGATLELRSGSFTNDGKFQAGTDGTTTLSIGGGATYTIWGTWQPPAGSTFELNGGIVQGGALAGGTGGAGALYNRSSGTLYDLNVSGTLVHGDDSITNLAGTITNDSPLTLTYDPAGSGFMGVHLAEDTTLAGTGAITVEGNCVTQGALVGGLPTKLTIVSGKTVHVASSPSFATRWSITGARVVNQGTLNVGVDSLLRFSTTNTYSQSAGAGMIVDGTLHVDSMPFTIAAGTFTGAGTLDNQRNTFTFAIPTASIGNIDGDTGLLVVNAGTTLTANRVRQHALNLAGTLRLRQGPSGPFVFASTSILHSLDLAGTAKLDLSDTRLIVRGGEVGSASGGGYTGITGLIQSGHNGGAWDGNGILTSMPDAAGGLTGIGIATAEQTGYAGGTFGGFGVSGTDVLVLYTYAGDANLDGFISGDDYSAIDFNIQIPAASGWYNGDFNYDGIISGDDYSVIDFNILAQGAPFATGGVAVDAVVAVPEPGAVAGLVVAGGLRSCRRRRRGVDRAVWAG